MIKINKLVVRFGQSRVLDIEKLDFISNKFYALVGPSGCGKTTLINVLSGAITKYQGEVFVDNRLIKSLSENNRLRYRMSTISVAYQDSVLFEDLTVLENIDIKLDFYPALSKKRRLHRIVTLLKELRIYHLKDKKAKYLSGGEKARVNIIRTVVSDAKVMVFDEPTAALDDENTQLVFSFLRQLSSSHTVIVVSHNREMVGSFAHTIVDLSYGKVSSIIEMGLDLQSSKQGANLVLGLSKQPNSARLFRLAWNIFKSRQKRNMFATFTFTFSLSAICALLVLTSSISSGIKNSFALNYDENTALITYKKTEPYPYRAGVNKEQALLLATRHNAKVGTIYLDDLDQMFSDSNIVYFQNQHIKTPLTSFSLESFNHVVFIDELSLLDIYGYRKATLRDDEVILMLPVIQQAYLYDHLNLRKGENLERLGEYLKSNETFIVLNVANNEWQFEDEQIFRLIGVTSGPCAGVVHSNGLFTETVLETKMLLPGSVEISKKEEYPWTLKKIYTLYKKNNEAIIYHEVTNTHVLLARASRLLVGDTFLNETYYDNRLCLFLKPQNYMTLSDEIDNNGFLLIRSGLTSYEQALMIGFSDNFIVGVSKEQVLEFVSYDERRLVSDTKTLLIGPRMANGHISLSLGDGLTFSLFESVNRGRSPVGLEEIVISTALYRHLFDEDFSEQNLKSVFVAAPRMTSYAGEFVEKNYTVATIKVVGVVNNEKSVIYHSGFWPLLYYKDVIKVDPFSLIPVGIVTTNQAVIQTHSLNRDFIVSYPFRSFSDSIESSITQMINIIYLVAFSALIMSMIVVFLVLQTLIDDFYRHFSLLYLFGMSRNRVIKIGLLTVGIVMLLSLLSSWTATIVVEIVVSRLIFTGGTILKDLLPYGITLILALVGLIPGYILLFFRVKNLKLCDLSKINL